MLSHLLKILSVHCLIVHATCKAMNTEFTKKIQQTLALFADTMRRIHVQRFKNICIGFPAVATLKRAVTFSVNQR